MSARVISELSSQVDSHLRETLAERGMDLYTMMSYHLGWGRRPGDLEAGPEAAPILRRHGVGCLVAALATSGGRSAEALPAAAAVEMVASFVEIHDDIQGGTPTRNGRDAVWWVWGPAQAINAGDGMHALARLTMLSLKGQGLPAGRTFRAMEIMDHASLAMCEGRFRDIEAQERIDMSVERYLEMAREKSGSLMSGALRIGALIGSGGDEDAADAFGSAGTELGVAMQVAGDLAELFPGDPAGLGQGPPSEDVMNKRKLLPVVHALQTAGPTERRRLGDVYVKRVLLAADVAEVKEVVEALGGRERAEEEVRYRREAAMSALEGVELDACGRSALKAFADALTDGG